MPLTRRWIKFSRLTLHRASGNPGTKLGCWTAPRLGSRFTQLVLSWSPCTVGFSWQLKLITQYETPKCPMVGSAACNRRPRRRWVDNIRMDLQDMGYGYMDWIGLAQDRDKWRTLVSAVMNCRVPWNVGNFLTSCKPVSFSRRTLHHGVSKGFQNEQRLFP